MKVRPVAATRTRVAKLPDRNPLTAHGLSNCWQGKIAVGCILVDKDFISPSRLPTWIEISTSIFEIRQLSRRPAPPDVRLASADANETLIAGSGTDLEHGSVGVFDLVSRAILAFTRCSLPMIFHIFGPQAHYRIRLV